MNGTLREGRDRVGDEYFVHLCNFEAPADPANHRDVQLTAKVLAEFLQTPDDGKLSVRRSFKQRIIPQRQSDRSRQRRQHREALHRLAS